MEACRNLLLQGLDSLALHLSESQVGQLISFIKLIEKWNKTYNLTAVRQLDEMVNRHILDSLALVPHISGKRIIDIGTGAGLPGIPLAICCPEIEFTLLDCNAKKTRFVQQAALELKLSNVAVCHQRVEEFHPDQKFDAVLTRAFASLPDTIKLVAHLLTKEGMLLAMKSQNIDEELAEITNATVIPLHVPGLDAGRCLVCVKSPV